MRQIIIIQLFFMLIIKCLNVSAQNDSFYMQIEDKQIIPVITRDKADNMILKSKDMIFNEIMKKYKISQFYQAFPTAVTPWLREIYSVKCDKKELRKELQEKLKEKIPLIEDQEELVATYTPNDYGLALGQTNLDLIHSKEAWDICKDLPKIGIAINDEQFDLNHEDLNLTLVGGNNNHIVPISHGTLVAGCISATTDNNKGLASIGYNTNLYVSSNWSDNGVLLLAQAGYRVINCSWLSRAGKTTISEGIYNEIRNIHHAVCVFSAGNEPYYDLFGRMHYQYSNAYPASYASNISVTSVGHIFNYGTQNSPPNNWKDAHEHVIGDSTTCHFHNAAVDICAPGYNVSTTDDMGSAGVSLGNYTNVWGSSFAAPQVSATMGLIFSVNPCLTADQGVAILLNNTDNSIYSIPENSRYIGKLGTGRLNVFAAVNAAAESATRYLQNQTLSGTQTVKANYAIRATGNVTVPSGANVNFITRKEVTLNGPFEVVTGATFSIDVNVNNVISCN